MRKILTLAILLAAIFGTKVWAEGRKSYRYIVQTSSGDSAIISIIEAAREPDNLQPNWIDLNTPKGRLSAEGACRNVKRFYDAGFITLMYSDFTKNENDPEVSYIDSWEELMMYVRGKK